MDVGWISYKFIFDKKYYIKRYNKPGQPNGNYSSTCLRMKLKIIVVFILSVDEWGLINVLCSNILECSSIL